MSHVGQVPDQTSAAGAVSGNVGNLPNGSAEFLDLRRPEPSLVSARLPEGLKAAPRNPWHLHLQ
jgi:hypothetical protein